MQLSGAVACRGPVPEPVFGWGGGGRGEVVCGGVEQKAGGWVEREGGVGMGMGRGVSG